MKIYFFLGPFFGNLISNIFTKLTKNFLPKIFNLFPLIADTITDLNHSAAKHKIAIRPNNRRTPSRLTNCPNAQLSEEEYVKAVGTISRSASLSSLDFIQDCHALLKTKSHSFKALPTLLLLDTLDSGLQDQPESRIGTQIPTAGCGSRIYPPPPKNFHAPKMTQIT